MWANGTCMVTIHASRQHTEAKWNLGKHVEVHNTELFGTPQATSYAKQWAIENTNTNTSGPHRLSSGTETWS